MYGKEYPPFNPQTEKHRDQLKARAPDREQFVSTNNLINKIVRHTIETGSVTGELPRQAANFHNTDSVIASISVITVILFAVFGYPFAATILIISNLYATTLLVVLNIRIKFRVESLLWIADGCELHDSRIQSSIRFNDPGSSFPEVLSAVETPAALYT